MSKRKKLKKISLFLLVIFLSEILSPTISYCLTEGPSQPEYQSFEPVGTTEMVNLFNGDFVYNIPLLDVDGYPINISYHAGIGMDQEASWVGLGWDLNPGAINRNMRGLPDDCNGEEIEKIQGLKPNFTVGLNAGVRFELFGKKLNAPNKELGITGDEDPLTIQPNLGIYYNNYKGVGWEMGAPVNLKGSNFSASLGLGFNSQNGISANASLNFNKKLDDAQDAAKSTKPGRSVSLSYNSLQGLTELGLENRRATGHSKTGGIGGVVRRTSISFANKAMMPHIGTPMNHFGFNLSFGSGIEFLGAYPHVKSSGYCAQQTISENIRHLKAFGYLHSEVADLDKQGKVLLDFNREKDEPYIKGKTTCLPISNFTYDYFTVSGHGTGGTFRPFRSDVGAVYDETIENGNLGKINLDNITYGADIGSLNVLKAGINAEMSFSHAKSGKWRKDNELIDKAKFRFMDFLNPKDVAGINKYQPFYFKMVGEPTPSDDNFYNKLDNENAMSVKVQGITAKDKFINKNGTELSVGTDFHKTVREKRNTNISYLTAQEAPYFALDKMIALYPNSYYNVTDAAGNYYTNNIQYINRYIKGDGTFDLPVKKDHLSELSVTNTDGTRYIYGIPIYNKDQTECSFRVAGFTGDCKTGLVQYVSTGAHADNQLTNEKGIDHYFSKTKIPAYANTYLLTSVVSPDYADITGDGVSDDDLGTAIKFNYTRTSGGTNQYKWRLPYKDASFSPGYKSDATDDIGSYTYGEKEIYYMHSIESKNYVAVFILDDRKDGIGVKDENGEYGSTTSAKLKCLKKIMLFSKQDLIKKGYYRLDGNGNNIGATPIKTVNFNYTYELCPKIPNNSDNYTGSTFKSNPTEGKLTLTQIYFTYGNSNRATFNSYKFEYPSTSTTNYSYEYKAYDRWGNYKPNVSTSTDYATCRPEHPLLTPDFPYVEQERKVSTNEETHTDDYAQAWCLKTITLPSGGVINIKYESDDYAFVQDKRAMQMVKILGIGPTNDSYWNIIDHNGESGNILYKKTYTNAVIETDDRWSDCNFLFFKMADGIPKTEESLKANYLNGVDSMYFNFLLNINPKDPNSFENINGMCQIESCGLVPPITGHSNNEGIAFIQLKTAHLTKNNTGDEVNPIAKIAWDYCRQNLLTKIYPSLDPQATKMSGDVKQSMRSLSNFATQLSSILTEFHRTMRRRNICCTTQVANSYIRLLNPTMKKKGGGVRVKEITLNDNWRSMTSTSEISHIYGQRFDYTTTIDWANGEKRTISSGVAEYEPLIGGEENPLFTMQKIRNRHILGQDDFFNLTLPIGESLYPAPNVGYSKVTVSNIHEDNSTTYDNNTGSVVNEFYTARDFPIIFEKTEIKQTKLGGNLLSLLLKVFAVDQVAVTQGYTLEFNDMHGKPKCTTIYANGQSAGNFISKVEYLYQCDELGHSYGGSPTYRLNNNIKVLKNDGTVPTSTVPAAKEIDCYTDMREISSDSYTFTLDVDLDQGVSTTVPPVPIIVPTIWPGFQNENTRLRTSVTTKVVRKYGILKETKTYDKSDKQSLSAGTLVYDNETGAPLLNYTQNEFKDKVYNFSYPAHWVYDQMGPAYKNERVNITGIKTLSGHIKFEASTGTLTDQAIADELVPGDEVLVIKDVYKNDIPNIGVFKAGVTIRKLTHAMYPDNFWSKEASYPVGKFWVLDNRCSSGGTSYVLIDKDGELIQNLSPQSTSDEKSSYSLIVLKSGRKNQMNTPVCQITSTLDPLTTNTLNLSNIPLIGATANEFSNHWPTYCCTKSYLQGTNYVSTCNKVVPCEVINPYLTGVLGSWRVKKTYTYLADRSNQNVDNSTRNETNIRHDGTFTLPQASGLIDAFWVRSSNIWQKANFTGTGWQETAEITKFSPFGEELERKDPLGIYSSALYAFNNKLPVAVSTNARINEIAYDGFEDYYYYERAGCLSSPHWNFLGNTAISNILSSSNSHTGKYSLYVPATSNRSTYTNLQVESDPTCTGSKYVLFPSECIGSFKPETNKEYLISGWVKKNSQSEYSYSDVKFTIDFISNTNTTTTIDFAPSGRIISGWQKVEGILIIPVNTKAIRIKAANNSSVAAYFDDIRIEPFKSKMKSFVYDPISLKVVAILDENNYSTFYEYDMEGNLTRTKKESENGVVTLKESRSNLKK